MKNDFFGKSEYLTNQVSCEDPDVFLCDEFVEDSIEKEIENPEYMYSLKSDLSKLDYEEVGHFSSACDIEINSTREGNLHIVFNIDIKKLNMVNHDRHAFFVNIEKLSIINSDVTV